MNKLIDFLTENPVGQFATIKDNKPVMRPFQFVLAKDGRFYFMTANTKEVYIQLKEAGVAGFAVLGKSMGWARLSGEVQFIDDIALKEEVFETSPLVRSIYKTPDNPILEMFYIHNGVADLYDNGFELVEEINI